MILGRPKKGALNLVDVGESACQDGEGCQVVDGLGGKNRLNQGGAACRSNVFSVPSGELPGAFILKVLNIFNS
jgi:hypothetical protein